MALEIKNRIVGNGEEPLDQIMFNPRNWRIHPKAQQKALRSILKEVGYVKEVIINQRTGNLLDGHLRCQIAAREGNTTIPVTYVDLSQDEENLMLATLDLSGTMAASDKMQLESLFQDIETENDDLMDFMNQIAKQEKLGASASLLEPEPPKEDQADILRRKWGTEKGQLWKLGDHLIICGDSTDPLVINRLLEGKKADMTFTDPPYLMNYQGAAGGEKTEAIENDNLDEAEAGIFLAKIAKQVKEFTKGSFYICFYRLGTERLIHALQNQGLTYRGLLIWYKSQFNLSNSDYQSIYEPIVYGWVDEHNFYGGRAQSDVLHARKDRNGTPSITTQAKAVYLKAGKNFYKFEKLVKQPANYIDIPEDQVVFNMHSGESDIWEIARTKENTLHPTMKPIELCERAIRNSSLPKQTVLDLFLGSGSTMIACERLGRKCRGAELTPEYTAVSIQRWVDETGGKPELLG